MIDINTMVKLIYCTKIKAGTITLKKNIHNAKKITLDFLAI